MIFINDKIPKAVNPEGKMITTEWKLLETIVEDFVSIGSGAVILPVKLGSYSLIGAGSVVTKSVPKHALVYGVPAEIKGIVCSCGNIIKELGRDVKCDGCGKIVEFGDNFEEE